MSKSQPWMKFYPQDWRADEKLRMCSLAARGLWIEMLAIMHRSERYGQLLISGRVPTDAQLAVQVGASPSEVTALLAELDGAGVFSRAASGAIYSRRMTHDGKKAGTARKNGKAGGNPTLCKSKENPASVKGKDKGEDKAEDKLRSQKPEAREKETPSGIGGTGARPANDQPLSELETHAREIADVIHLPRPIAKADRDVLRGWLDDGLNFDFHVMPAVRDVAARELGRGKSISGFRYLDGAVREYADGWHRENERLKAIAAGGRK